MKEVGIKLTDNEGEAERGTKGTWSCFQDGRQMDGDQPQSHQVLDCSFYVLIT